MPAIRPRGSVIFLRGAEYLSARQPASWATDGGMAHALARRVLLPV
jgi:hypothetical protein